MDYILILCMSVDTLLACIACGARGIKIPFSSRVVIAAIGTACLAISFFLKHILTCFLPVHICTMLGCITLMLIALVGIFDEACRRIANLLAARCKSFQFRLRNLKIVLEIYAENVRADRDCSGLLSPAEAFLLALPLSVDSLLTGLSITLTPYKIVALLLLLFVGGFFAAVLGARIGKRLGHALGQNAPLLSGLLLFTIALCKMLG